MTGPTVQSSQRDWFLIGIVAGIAILIVVGLVLALQQPEPAEYLPETSPEGVAFNYLLALERKEYDRAYGYLSEDLPNPPADAGEFFAEIEDSFSCFDQNNRTSQFEIEEVESFENRAVVTMSETVFTRGDLFSRGSYTNQFPIDLIQETEGWRISNSSRCWSFEWNREQES